jgi:hypothetical protein
MMVMAVDELVESFATIIFSPEIGADIEHVSGMRVRFVLVR